MKRNQFCGSLLLGMLLSLGCNSTNPAQVDADKMDFMILRDQTPGDDRQKLPDMSVDLTEPTVDGNVACTRIENWPGLDAKADYRRSKLFPQALAPALNVVTSANQVDYPRLVLGIADYQAIYPFEVDIGSSDETSEDCELCAVMGLCISEAQCVSSDYFAQSGTLRVEHADKNEDSGHMVVTAKNLRLVQWNGVNELPIPGGKCFEIGTVNLDVSWRK